MYLYLWLKNWFESLDNEEGQGLVEYALIIFLVSVALVVALGVLKNGISGVFSNIAGVLGS
jgi:pilus assembly protein Flp/PilA